MIGKLVATGLIGLSGTVFTMCGTQGKVPAGCCKHGDRLDIVLSGDDWASQCNEMGGEPILYARSDVKVCEGVDF